MVCLRATMRIFHSVRHSVEMSRCLNPDILIRTIAASYRYGRAAVVEQAKAYSTTYATSYHSSDDEALGPNPGLESVIGQGRSSLDRTASDVQAKTKKVSSLAMDKEKSKTPRQLAESQRILEVATECIEAICDRDPRSPLAIGGEPLTLLEVQVNSNAKLAKVYWTLPYSVLLDPRLTPTTYRQLMAHVEAQFDGSLLQKQVHTRLSFYYPPRLKFHPATPQMLTRVMQELLGEY